MTTQDRFNLITKDTEEIITHDDLQTYLENDYPMKHYIGFEISGKIHLGTGLACMLKIKDFLEAGVECTVFLADWHTWLNGKLGGDLETIKRTAVGYFKEGMKASMLCLGGNPDRVKYLLGSDLYHNNDAYWQTLVEVSQKTTHSRVLRSLDILGRKQEAGLEFAKLIYPPMQVADIFIQDLTIAHGGMDQRKAHVIMREVADQLKICPVKRGGKVIKPLAIHHHILLGLLKPTVWPIPQEQMRELWIDMKMSKSKPEGAVFIHDPADEIVRKVENAFCPPQEVEYNPVIDWCKNLLYKTRKDFALNVRRDPRYGGDKTYTTVAELEEEYRSGNLHPQDLKKSVSESLINLLEPARKHFSTLPAKVYLRDLEDLKISR